MRVVQLFQYLLHDSFTEQNGPGTYPKFVTIMSDCRHFTVVQVDNLTMAAHKRCLLFFKIFRIHSLFYFLFSSHGKNLIILGKGSKKSTTMTASSHTYLIVDYLAYNRTHTLNPNICLSPMVFHLQHLSIPKNNLKIFISIKKHF